MRFISLCVTFVILHAGMKLYASMSFTPLDEIQNIFHNFRRVFTLKSIKIADTSFSSYSFKGRNFFASRKSQKFRLLFVGNGWWKNKHLRMA